MSDKARAWVWDHSKAKSTDKFVLVAIADSANEEGEDAFPKQATLAAKCGISERCLRDAIKRLVEMGELGVEEHAGGSGKARFYSPRHRPNRYTLLAMRRDRQDLPPTDRQIPPLTDRQDLPLSVVEPSFEPSITTAALFEAPPEEPPPSEPKKAKAPRARNPYWDALVAVFGEPKLATERSVFGKYRRELEEAGVDPAEVAIRARRYRSRWPGASLTVHALVVHWSELEPERPPSDWMNPERPSTDWMNPTPTEVDVTDTAGRATGTRAW